MKKIWLVPAIAALLLGVFAATRLQHSTPIKVIKIGVSQIVSHPVIDAVKEGMSKEFAAQGYKDGSTVVFDFQNAQGEASINQAIAQKFAASDYDLFIPLGTQSSQALATVIKNRPIVFGGVSEPVSAGLVASNDHPGGNITGTSDITLFKENLGLLKKLAPKVKIVGIVYNPGEDNSAFGIAQTKKYAADLGIEIVTAPANDGGEVLNAARSIANKVDAFYMIADNTVVSAQAALIKVALESKKPLIALDQSGVEAGALATLGTNYEKLGEQTAALAIRVLKGEKPSDMPVIGITQADMFINTKTAAAINLTIAPETITQAKHVYQ